MAFTHSGCLKNSWFVDLSMPPRFTSAFWIRARCASLNCFWLEKLIGTEKQIDEEQFNHQVEAACKECMLKIECVSGLV